MFTGILNIHHEILEKGKVFMRPETLMLVVYLKLHLNFLGGFS